MTLSRSFRFVLALISLAVLAGCVQPGGGEQDIDISQFVQTEAKNLRAIDLLPRGLGSDGEALLLVEIADESPEIATSELFDLKLASQVYDAENRRTVVTFVLSSSDYRRFTEVQIKLRAQLLAGYAQLRMIADSTVCDEAGVELERNDSPLVIQNAATGRTIMTVRPSENLSAIKDRVPYCT